MHRTKCIHNPLQNSKNKIQNRSDVNYVKRFLKKVDTTLKWCTFVKKNLYNYHANLLGNELIDLILKVKHHYPNRLVCLLYKAVHISLIMRTYIIVNYAHNISKMRFIVILQ